MFETLEEILPSTFRLHAQVAMGALLEVTPRAGTHANPAARAGFAQKIVDFAVQDRATGQIVGLIEIDDPTHRADRDRKRDAMTTLAGYRTFRIPGRVTPAIGEVRPILETLVAPVAIPSPLEAH